MHKTNLKRFYVRFVAHCALALSFATPATAQSSCGPSGIVRAIVSERFGEVIVWRGLSQYNIIIEVWRSVETGAWTVLHHSADGVGCIVDIGLASDVMVLPNGDPA